MTRFKKKVPRLKQKIIIMDITEVVLQSLREEYMVVDHVLWKLQSDLNPTMLRKKWTLTELWCAITEHHF